MADGSESFIIDIDTSAIKKEAEETKNVFVDIGDAAEDAGKRIDVSLSNALNTDKLSEGTEAVTDAMEGMGEQAEETASSLDKISESGAASTLQETASAADSVAVSQGNLNTKLEEGEAVIEKHNSTMVSLLGGEEKYKAIMDALPDSVSKTIKTIEGLTAASKAFIATPLGAALAVIVLALTSLVTWFKSSSEGEEAFAKVTGYASGILGQLKEIVIAVGKALWETFTNPKKAVEGLWKTIKTNLLNRIAGIGETFKVLGEMIASVFSGDFDKGKWADMGNRLFEATSKASTGVENLTEKVGKYAAKTKDAIKKTADLNSAEFNLHKRQRQAALDDKDDEAALAKLRDEMYKNGANKTAIQARAQEIVNKKAERNLAIAKEELRIQQERMALTASTEADYDKEAELIGKIKDIQIQRTQEMMRFNRASESQMSSLQKSATKAGKDAENKEAKDAKTQSNLDYSRYQRSLQDAETDRKIQEEIDAARIEAMEEGEKKVLAQMEFQAKQERDAVEKQRADALKQKVAAAKAEYDAEANNKRVFDPSKITLTDDENAKYDELLSAIEAKIAKARSQYQDSINSAMNTYLKEYGSYTEKMQAITETYQGQISKAGSQGEKQSLAMQMMEEIKKAQEEYRNSLESLSDDSLQSMLDSLTQIVAKNKEAFSPETLDVYLSQIEELSGELAERNPFQILKNAAEELKQAEYETSIAFQNLIYAQNEVAQEQANVDTIKGGGEAFDELGNIMTLQQAEDRLATAKLKEVRATQDLAQAQNKESKARSKVQKATSTSLASCRKLTSALTQVGEAIGGTVGDIITVVGRIGDTVMAGIEGMKAASAAGATAIATVEKASVILAIISAALQIATKIVSMFTAAHDGALQDDIDRLQKQIDNLKDSYDELGKVVEKTFSKVKENNINKQIANQQKQISLINQQIIDEQKKKKTDDDAIDDYKDKIKELQENIRDLKEQAKDAIFGEDITSAIENFASNYADAWASGESKVKSAKDTVKDMMRAMVTESIKSALQASSSMEQIREKLREFYSDNVLTGWEQDYIYKMAEGVQEEINKQFGWADSLMSDSSSQSNTAGGFAAANQESVDELNGRFTAIQMTTTEMSDKLDVIIGCHTESVDHLLNIRLQTEQSVNLAQEAVSQLGAIEKNTRELYSMNDRLDKIERNTRNL